MHLPDERATPEGRKEGRKENQKEREKEGKNEEEKREKEQLLREREKSLDSIHPKTNNSVLS